MPDAQGPCAEPRPNQQQERRSVESSAEGLQEPKPRNSCPSFHGTFPPSTELLQPCGRDSSWAAELRTGETNEQIPKARLGQSVWLQVLPTPPEATSSEGSARGSASDPAPSATLALGSPTGAEGQRDTGHPNRSCSHHH